ncbi:MAG: galactose-1-phosphate uridylyltransferase [Candidatus Hydrothermia bacterium]
MPELRYDVFRVRWTIISTERGRRPSDYVISKEEIKTGVCPFCYGHEHTTPPEIFVIGPKDRTPNSDGWEVRVVPNKFPALRVEGELTREGVGLFDRMNGIGAHEVIIETSEHDKNLSDLSVDQIKKVLIAYRERIKDLRKDLRIRYVLVFKNYGKEAGASLSHPHSQLIATPMIPTVVITELQASRDHYRAKERCLLCDILNQELQYGSRIVMDRDGYVVWEPFASSFPFETWLIPKKHLHDFVLLEDYELETLASVLKEMLLRIKLVLNDPPFNMVLHTAPSPHPRPGREEYWTTIENDYHWHIELIPRITKIAGFEWGSGLYINPTPPEEAAVFLREADVSF